MPRFSFFLFFNLFFFHISFRCRFVVTCVAVVVIVYFSDFFLVLLVRSVWVQKQKDLLWHRFLDHLRVDQVQTALKQWTAYGVIETWVMRGSSNLERDETFVSLMYSTLRDINIFPLVYSCSFPCIFFFFCSFTLLVFIFDEKDSRMIRRLRSSWLNLFNQFHSWKWMNRNENKNKYEMKRNSNEWKKTKCLIDNRH